MFETDLETKDKLKRLSYYAHAEFLSVFAVSVEFYILSVQNVRT